MIERIRDAAARAESSLLTGVVFGEVDSVVGVGAGSGDGEEEPVFVLPGLVVALSTLEVSVGDVVGDFSGFAELGAGSAGTVFSGSALVAGLEGATVNSGFALVDVLT